MKQKKMVIGWREWLALPDLGIQAIKAKVDTGARTSALHTFGLEPFEKDGTLKVKFTVHPLQRRNDIEVCCVADVVDRRRVTSSDGQNEKRYVIQTIVALGDIRWPIELTLTNRRSMRFRMLLGRAAVTGPLLVDPAKSYLTGRKLSKIYPIIKKN
ncbi:MAG: ATP-dependent zinc protease [Desulfobacteraceae bacterium]|nr:ATP-dependent zinc protease [Desulfobacteraceae bacterium]